MSCPHAVDDGAYVLGALSPAERGAFERHLATCRHCREAVATLAVLPGLLGRLDATTAAAATAASPAAPAAAASTSAAPAGLLDRVLAAAAASRRRDRARRLRLGLAAGVVALSLAAGVGVAVHVADRPTPPAAQTAMVPVSEPMRVSAELSVVTAPGGSRIDMTCRYSDEYPGKWTLRLVVFPRHGVSEQVGTWTAAAGQELTVTASTHIAPPDVDHVELQRGDRTPILTWSPPP